MNLYLGEGAADYLPLVSMAVDLWNSALMGFNREPVINRVTARLKVIHWRTAIAASRATLSVLFLAVICILLSGPAKSPVPAILARSRVPPSATQAVFRELRPSAGGARSIACSNAAATTKAGTAA